MILIYWYNIKITQFLVIYHYMYQLHYFGLKEKSDLLFGYGYAPAQHGNSFK